MRKLIASVAAAGTLAAGGIAVAVLNPFESVGAQSGPPTTASPPTAPAPDSQPKRADAVNGVLDELVQKGTITAEQRDAIVAAFKEHRGEFRSGGLRGRIANRRELGQAVATVLGITPQELRADLQGGQSIAEVAASKNVPLQQVTDKLTAEITARIDKAVADGKLDATKAATVKAKVPQMVDKIVNHKRK